MEAVSLFLQSAPLDVVFSSLPAPFDASAQEDFFKAAIAPFLSKYPPPLKYLKSFLKRLMKLIEGHNLDIIDGLADLAVNTSVKDYSTTDDAESEGYLIFQIKCPNVTPNTTQNSLPHILKGCCTTQGSWTNTKNVIIKRNNYHNQVGMKLWKAGLLMGDFCVNVPHLFRGRSVLELGSGTGVTGITLAAICRPSKLCMTDFHDEVLQNLEYNAGINVEMEVCQVVVSHLDWSVQCEKKIVELESDIIIAADCTYSPDLCVIVLQTISSFLRCHNSLHSSPASCARYSEWKATALSADSSTPSILFRSRKICFLCFTIRAPETLDFFFEAINHMSAEIEYEDVTSWVLRSCVASSFYYDGGRDDLRVLCIVPTC